MNNYDATDLSKITQYSQFVKKLIDMQQEFEKLKDKQLSNAESLYFAEIELRCSQKLLEATKKLG